MLTSHPASTLHSNMQAARPTTAWFGSFRIHAVMACKSASVSIVSLTLGEQPYTDRASNVITTTAKTMRCNAAHCKKHKPASIDAWTVPFNSSSKLDICCNNTVRVTSCAMNRSLRSAFESVKTIKARHAVFRRAASSCLHNVSLLIKQIVGNSCENNQSRTAHFRRFVMRGTIFKDVARSRIISELLHIWLMQWHTTS